MKVNPFAVKETLRDNGIRPTKQKGQHFIVDPSIADRQVSHADLSPGDLVFEIGAGLGGLTERIACRGNRLVTIEIDRRLLKLLEPRFKGNEKVSLIMADVLSFHPNRVDKIVSNIPYNISSQVTFRILEMKFKTAVLTYQIDFARRMVAKPGSKDYSRLTVNVYYRAEAQILDRVSRNAFYPIPSVDSAIIRLKRREPPFHVANEPFFFAFLREFFPYRNQLVRKVLARFVRSKGLGKVDTSRIIRDAEVEDRRVRDVSPESMARLSDDIFDQMKHAGLAT